MNCLVLESDTPHRYVAGTLPEDEAERFEQHLLECAWCRDAVRLGAATRTALLAETGGRRLPRTRWWAAAGAVAAGIMIFAFARRDDGLRALSTVQAPPFVGTEVRSIGGDSTIAMIDRGIAAYANGDYERAARALQAAGDSSPGVSFYLGASLLARERPRDALVALRRATTPSENPYADDARILAAKAWLRESNGDSALAELRAVSRSSPAIRHADALADSIRRKME